MPETAPLYPLLFDPIYKEKVWGGRALERLGRVLPGDAATPIGESWELVDLASTSASGGGGGAEHSVVSNGPLAGKTIRELMQTYGESLLGRGVQPADDGGFPLLIKFLDAKENLSVQVHPSPQYAAEHPGAHLKSEAWYVVDAKPGAVIYKGLVPGVTEAQLRAALEANTDDAVVPLLNAVPVKPGDCHYLPSGTLHALGAGVLVAEVQTPSDTTFRVYDWGRTDRELHVEQAMACIDFGNSAVETHPAHASVEEVDSGLALQRLVDCDFFAIEEIVFSQQAEYTGLDGESPNSLCVWIAVEGKGGFTCGDGAMTQVRPASTVLLPASCWPYTQTNLAGGRWLRVIPKSPTG